MSSGSVANTQGVVATDPTIAAITGGNTWVLSSASAVAVSAPADTTEDTLQTIAIPSLSANAILRVTAVWTFTNNANTKTIRFRLSGAAGTAFASAVCSSQVNLVSVVLIANRNATNSQIGQAFFPSSNNAILGQGAVTGSIDTSVATSLVITGQKATSTDALTLESYSVEIYKP